jgi:hypothetical protein
VLTIADCVFQSNTFDYFVGGGGSVAFVRCIFDVPELNVTLAVAVATTGCAYEANRTSLMTCGPLMPLTTKGPTPNPPTWAIAGIAAGGGVLLIALIAVIVKRARRKRDQPPRRIPIVMGEPNPPPPYWSVPQRAIYTVPQLSEVVN